MVIQYLVFNGTFSTFQWTMAKEGLKQFGWKRKIGAQISKTASSVFEKEAKDDDDDVTASGDVDWLTLVPVNKKRVIGLEDNVGKSERLAKDGAMLAESERYCTHLPNMFVSAVLPTD